MKCDNCDCKDECGYYEETINPIKEAIILGNDEFSYKIKNILEEFECEYFILKK